MEFEWLAENPFNTIKKYDVFYWGLDNAYKPRLISDCKKRQNDGSTLSIVKLIKTNVYESISNTTGISSYNQSSFGDLKKLHINLKHITLLVILLLISTMTLLKIYKV